MVTSAQTTTLRSVAAILLPGDGVSPPAPSVPDFDILLAGAVAAMEPEAAMLERALETLPDDLSWDSLRDFAGHHPEEFEVLSTAVAGAYFMSPHVLDSIGYPHGPRRAARNDQIVDELETGILDQVMQRESMVRQTPS